jgi:hypothetical protein
LQDLFVSEATLGFSFVLSDIFVVALHLFRVLWFFAKLATANKWQYKKTLEMEKLPGSI